MPKSSDTPGHAGSMHRSDEAGNIRFELAPGETAAEPLLRSLVTDFETTGESIYKARNELKRMQWNGEPVIVKSFAIPNFIRRYIYGRFRASKAGKSFHNAQTLERLGVGTPSPIGYIERFRGGGLTRSFYVSHEWAADFTIREPLMDHSFPGREEILQALGRFAWELHRKNVFHRDFSPGNILIRAADSGPPAFALVDVNRMCFRPLSLKARMQNFAMLWADQSDLKTIMSGYTQASGDAPAHAAALALEYSAQHKARAMRKERLKTLLRLH
jgi:tRNA A-37 threonylcarbamoyl transferase component Bud32